MFDNETGRGEREHPSSNSAEERARLRLVRFVDGAPVDWCRQLGAGRAEDRTARTKFLRAQSNAQEDVLCAGMLRVHCCEHVADGGGSGGGGAHILAAPY